MMFPKKKWNQEKSKTMAVECPEGLLQQATDEYLTLKQFWFFRIPDAFFRWLKMNAPIGIQKFFFGMFGGMPDNTIIVPIGEGVAIALLLELKTQDKKGRAIGQLHGKQKHHENDYLICRSTKQVIEEIEKFEKKVEIIKKTLQI